MPSSELSTPAASSLPFGEGLEFVATSLFFFLFVLLKTPQFQIAVIESEFSSAALGLWTLLPQGFASCPTVSPPFPPPLFLFILVLVRLRRNCETRRGKTFAFFAFFPPSFPSLLFLPFPADQPRINRSESKRSTKSRDYEEASFFPRYLPFPSGGPAPRELVFTFYKPHRLVWRRQHRITCLPPFFFFPSPCSFPRRSTGTMNRASGRPFSSGKS